MIISLTPPQRSRRNKEKRNPRRGQKHAPQFFTGKSGREIVLSLFSKERLADSIAQLLANRVKSNENVTEREVTAK